MHFHASFFFSFCVHKSLIFPLILREIYLDETHRHIGKWKDLDRSSNKNIVCLNYIMLAVKT